VPAGSLVHVADGLPRSPRRRAHLGRASSSSSSTTTCAGIWPKDLRVAVQIAHTFGWRTQSEILTLERRHVGLEASTLRLDPGTTKIRAHRTESVHRRSALKLAGIIPGTVAHLAIDQTRQVRDNQGTGG